MLALITNDDGIASPGLVVLARVAQAAGYDVVIAAPKAESSGASAALHGAELDGRLMVEPAEPPGLPDGVRAFAVSADPALITFSAAYGAFGARPDLVLSGVNRGPNVGNAVLYSGTVGAALAATSLGIRAVAVSLDAADPVHWDTAEQVAAHALAWFATVDAGRRTLNVNVPDLPPGELRGLRQAPLASFGAVHARVVPADPLEAGRRGDDVVIRYEGTERHTEPESDAGMLDAGWATATLLVAPWADTTLAVPPLG
ncbi:Survival protein SurE [Xylanimonas cellulosilytica DSM 15894]|uniref:5'-nucleotidase n=1 Tax=Xylanimonas cellulosilytica (strain DSM 15894 / JCM 12276 / CECT 5975 / KCTC 9989 / LMG 20990 / NBRC 107835 / XIL07) TaxID=446471 RepID=D1BXY9_XYLCX|nr:5'/3'-nucleotidase SurE [Xylanimonas cellulosilytica]ACZ31780.1 Survival protein SurE [Xylanimonas cellulosilytica DSM 15894]